MLRSTAGAIACIRKLRVWSANLSRSEPKNSDREYATREKNKRLRGNSDISAAKYSGEPK